MDAEFYHHDQRRKSTSVKEDYLDHFRCADRSTLLVSAADKLHNLRAIQSDFLQIGDAVFDRFSTPGGKTRTDAEIFGRKIDVVSKRGLRPGLDDSILADSVHAF